MGNRKPHNAATKYPRIVRALMALNRIYAHGVHKVELIEPCSVPMNGGGILICNHASSIDPLLLQATCPRLLTWMMAKEYYELPIVGYAFRELGYIPVSRNGRDSASLKAALRALGAGRMMGIFPEGRIEPTRELLKLQPGVAMMAMRADVPIYTAYIAGLRLNTSTVGAMIEPQHVSVLYGPTLHLSGDVNDATAHLRDTLELLKSRALAARLPRCPPAGNR